MIILPGKTISWGGGAGSGNFTFSLTQQVNMGTNFNMSDPKDLSWGTAPVEGNLLLAVVTERDSGTATLTVTESGKTWTEIRTDSNGTSANDRFSMGIFWREADASETTSTVTGDAGTDTCGLWLVEIAPSAAYGWTAAGDSAGTSGTGEIDNLSSGAASPSAGNDIFVMGIWGSRTSGNYPTTKDFDEYTNAFDSTATQSNRVLYCGGFLTTSQADTSSYTSTVDVAATGSGNEGICATILFKDV